MGAIKEVVVPDIGDFEGVDVIEILVKPGETVAAEQSLITLESDKATMDIPAPEPGVVKELRVKVGDKVSQGVPILTLEAGDVPAASAPAAAKPAQAPAQPTQSPVPARPASPPAAQPAPAAAPAGARAAAGGVQEVRVPDIGDFKDVEVIEVMVKSGDKVAAEASLITVESDKATMEIPSPAAGVVRDVKLKVGDKVSEGSLILMLEGASGAPAQAQAAPAAAPAAPPAAQPAVSPSSAASAREDEAPFVPQPLPTRTGPVPYEPTAEPATFKPHASPSIRKFARELGVDLAKVKGSGPKGRILQGDVQAFVKGVMTQAPAPARAAAAAGGALPFNLPDWPKVDFAKYGPVEVKPLSRIKRISGANLHRNWVSIPHVTQFDEADITELEAFRKASSPDSEKQGFKLTLLAFLLKACMTALRQHPEFNASLDGDNLVVKKYYHIGVAVDTPDGLVVPVIRDVDRKGVFDLARELAEVSKLARDKKLKPGDMQGGTFSISSLGGIGGTAFTPIINAPEVAILGVSRSSMRPVYKDGQFVPRLMLPLSLSYDHRVIDGALAARFTSYLASVLSDIRRSLL
jgi:pyruvate dehydrogenase E2 component (dihydrolipoyllysine-residue acetyltransferase)